MTTTANVLIKTVRQSAHELELWLNARPRKRYLKERKGEYWYIVKDEYRYGQQHLRRELLSKVVFRRLIQAAA